ncbi:KdsC family phosphatase [Aminiphilus circumscriptus]|jgi:3-deoxy-D-manno-octulosonate 8-phosphate phosphatase (KDO 8-P phosphatase)|uniref:KdsC family phosphatase n=1 Tax=Aminiphilus circumscriptus TaxID=290732 RepID=UPI0004924378|nr:HAD-IIIA family hydrolase [Aminiphilus circumscriptus]
MIRLFALDVDGTLTDGGVWMDGCGNEWKRFDIQDGMGIVRLRTAGVEIAFLSGRHSAATAQRAADLGVERCVNGVLEKLPVLCRIADELGLVPEEVAFVGDDVNDIPCLRWSGLGIAVANARPEVKRNVRFVTSAAGGFGAVREAAEHVLFLNAREKAAADSSDGIRCGFTLEETEER